jgi:hypothetical protein
MVTRLELHEVTKALGDLSLSIAQTRELAFNLGVELRELDNVDEERRGNDRTKYYMQIWLNNNPDASWRSIIEALKSMRLNRQATQLTEMLSAGPEVTHPVSSHPSLLAHAGSGSTGESFVSFELTKMFLYDVIHFCNNIMRWSFWILECEGECFTS